MSKHAALGYERWRVFLAERSRPIVVASTCLVETARDRVHGFAHTQTAHVEVLLGMSWRVSPSRITLAPNSDDYRACL